MMKISDALKIKDTNLLKDRVYETIKHEILSLNFPPNTQLVEQELCKGIGVSKSPIRDAFVRLEAEGLVSSIPYRGCFVSAMSIQEFVEIFQFREALEVYAIDKTLEKYGEADLKHMRQIIEKAIEYVDGGSEIDGYTHHMQFHTFVVAKLGNETISGIYRNAQDKLMRYLYIFKARNSNEQTLKVQHQNLLEHFDIIDAMAAKNRPRVLSILRSHLSNIHQFDLESEDLKMFSDTKTIENQKD
jgi:DNA-binding GntR family transcriptional regulator